MIGKQSVARPTALGTLLSSGVYGSPLTQIYGTGRFAPMPIWAGHLRKGSSSKKGKKKGTATYVEDIDLFCATNPFMQVLQIWSNQRNTYPLNFFDLRANANAGGSWHNTITIADPNFFAVCAVALEGYVLPTTFTDYGAPTSNVYDATLTIFLPCWNGNQHGPDLTDPANALMPLYYWKPADGNVVTTPGLELLNRAISAVPHFVGSFYLHIYYASTTPVTKHQSPLAYNRFFLESQLGNGGEYADAGEPGQQIIYPEYAGIGSLDMDLGASAAVPSWRMEGMGSFYVLPSQLQAGVTDTPVTSIARGDAEFPDIIIDIIKGSMRQYGEALGYIPTGLNNIDLPGPVQKMWGNLLAVALPPLKYTQPNTAGSILLAFWNTGLSGGPATITDSAGNTWVNVLSTTIGGGGVTVAYALNCVGFTGNVVSWGASGNGNTGYLLELDPGSQTLDATSVTAAPTGVTTASITTTGPGYIVAYVAAGSVGTPTVQAYPYWTNLFPMFWPNNANGTQATNAPLYGRKTNNAGTYTFTINNGSGTTVQIVLIAVKSSQPAGTLPYPKTLGNIIDFATLDNLRQACRCGGLQGSLVMDQQKAASDWLQEIYECANAWPVWSGFKLKSIARSEVSQIGDGSAANVTPAVSPNGLYGYYVAPTSAGPVFTITEDMMVGEPGKPLVTVKRKALVDADNIFQIQHLDRNNKYNQAITEQPEAGTLGLGIGPRKAQPKVLNEIVDPQVARKLAAILVRRKTKILNSYEWVGKARLFPLEAGDLVAINDSLLNIVNKAVRVTQIEEDVKTHNLKFTAEPYIYALHSPNLNTIVPGQSTTPYAPNTAGVPAAPNTPIIFEPPLAMCLSGAPEIWIVVSDSDTNYGGSLVYISVDGGATYQQLSPQITGNATTGVLSADFPIANDPDTTDTITVDLTESLGTLPVQTATDYGSLTYDTYLAPNVNASTLYELVTYETPMLTGTPYVYDVIGSSGNPIRRSVFGMPTAGVGIDHPATSRFAWLDNRFNNTPPGILKIPLNLAWIGKTLNFKLVQFNQFGAGVADLSSATAYPFTPQGVATGTGGTAGSGGGTGGNPSQPNYQVIGCALTNPTSTTIHMAAGSVIYPDSTVAIQARTFTIAAPGVPTTYYVTLFDPNHVGDVGATLLTSSCVTSPANVGLPGWINIGFIVAEPAGGGTGTGGGGFPLPLGITVNGS